GEDPHLREGRRGARTAGAAQAHPRRGRHPAARAQLDRALGLRGRGVDPRRPPAEDLAASRRRAAGGHARPQGAQDPEGGIVNLQIRMGEGGDVVGTSFWAEVGGRATFEKIVRRFYEGVRADELLWPMYPEDDLEGAIQRL